MAHKLLYRRRVYKQLNIKHTFDDFKYNKEEFIVKISGGRTSTHNEAINSVLFQMVRKTEAVGMDMTANHNEAIHSVLFQMVRKTEAVGMDT